MPLPPVEKREKRTKKEEKPILLGAFCWDTDGRACGRPFESRGVMMGVDKGFVCIFAVGENYSVAAIQLAASRCPPDTCI